MFNLSYYIVKLQPFGIECVFKHHDLQMFCIKLIKSSSTMTNFCTLEVVDRGSETQQVTKKIFNLAL